MVLVMGKGLLLFALLIEKKILDVSREIRVHSVYYFYNNVSRISIIPSSFFFKKLELTD